MASVFTLQIIRRCDKHFYIRVTSDLQMYHGEKETVDNKNTVTMIMIGNLTKVSHSHLTESVNVTLAILELRAKVDLAARDFANRK
jgi:hypothetical protein